jgi:predicted nucleotide-binding protein
MDSKLEQLRNLLRLGQGFNFNNFFIKDDSVWGLHAGPDSPEWLSWKTRVGNLVSEVVENDSPPIEMLAQAWQIETLGHDRTYFERQKNLLISALQLSIEIAQDDVFGELKRAKTVSSSAVISNRVFIVHGHDEVIKMELEIFLRNIGLIPIVLHRQVDQGLTLIEKFEENADVGFAFIILTPDDIAFTADQKDVEDALRKKEFRARPNVIFEFGYFVGRLTRARVCCLVKGNVSQPSDLNGLMYKRIDGPLESKAYEIIQELQAAGYTLNL